MPVTRSGVHATPEFPPQREVGRDMFREFEDLANKVDELSLNSKARWRRNQPRMDCTQFSGDPTESIIAFLDEFVRDMTIHEYEIEQYMHHLPRLLTGRALAWFEMLDEASKSTWENLRAAMITEFTSGYAKTQAHRALMGATKKASESILEFVWRIKRLAKTVYNEENDKYLCDFVFRGLPRTIQEKN